MGVGDEGQGHAPTFPSGNSSGTHLNIYVYIYIYIFRIPIVQSTGNFKENANN
jgi:hypothetical protein